MVTDRHIKGFSLVWDEKGKFRDQTWGELKERLHKTQGGLGILADDFIEMLGGHGDITTSRGFSALVAEATSDDDIKLLAKVLSVMLIDPWKTNITCGFFIAKLLKNNSKDVDVERGALILNQLYQLNSYVARVLCRTLSDFVASYSDSLTLMDKIKNTNKLDRNVLLLITV